MPLTSSANLSKWEPIAFFSVALVVWAVGIFSSWTLVHTIATFGHIPWHTTKIIALATMCGVTLLAVYLARLFGACYAANLDRHDDTPAFPPVGALGILVFATCLYILPTYFARFCVASIAFLCLAYGVRKKGVWPERQSQPSTLAPRFEIFFFATLLCVVLLYTLCAYKSDYDDSEYLQIAVQTLLHPERAPLSFDASLGYVVEPFRFPPYRFTAYENFAAFLADVCSIDLMTVYYILLPALGSVLCMCCAYLLARWFLSRTMALVALFVFLLVIVAWGETSIAYGSRMLVRLYQGKGWLVAVSTPFIVLCGLMLMREKKLAVWLCYIVGNIAAVGFSSSGLVVTFGTVLLLAPLAFARTVKKTVGNLLVLGSGLVYPLLCGSLLVFKYKNVSSFAIERIPIDASLGGDGRECLTLALFVLVACLRGTGRQRELFLLVGGTLFLIINPWGAEIVAQLAAQNMRWRLAWAAPVPIIMAILVVTFWEYRRSLSSLFLPAKPALFAGLCVIILFLCIAPWTCRQGNGDFHFSFPVWKLPPEYAEVQQIAKKLPGAASEASTLLPFLQGAWLPVIRPDIRVIMPGHGYPVVLPRIMSQQEFHERVELQGIPENPHLEMLGADRFFYLIAKFNVKYIVTPKGSRTKETLSLVNNSVLLQAELLHSTTHFDILEIRVK